MNWFEYTLNSIKKLHTQDVKDCLAIVEQRTGKSKPEILWDMALCAFRHQAGFYDYTIFGMYDMTEEQRQKVLTRGKNVLHNIPRVSDIDLSLQILSIMGARVVWILSSA